MGLAPFPPCTNIITYEKMKHNTLFYESSFQDKMKIVSEKFTNEKFSENTHVKKPAARDRRLGYPKRLGSLTP